MKDHARHVPGSIRSRRTAFSRSVPFFLPSSLSPLPSEKCDHYASKMRPNLKTQILINSLPTTYNFELKKWSHFPATERFPLPWGEGQGEGQTGSLFSVGSSHHPFSLGEKVRMRDKPVLRSRSPHVATKFTTLYRIVKIGELADFRPNRPRCTKYLRKRKSAYADFLQKPFSGKNRNFPESGSLCLPDRSLTV